MLPRAVAHSTRTSAPSGAITSGTALMRLVAKFIAETFRCVGRNLLRPP
jgi:hypothetical protein